MDYVELKISKGMITKIDKDDFNKIESLGLLKWNAQKSGRRFYVSRNTKDNGKIYLHRLIMDCEKGLCVDHINGDSLDNRKENLRVCSYRQNSANSFFGESKGITKSRNGKYISQITYCGKRYLLGVFEHRSDACRIYDLASAMCFGEFSKFNFAFSKKFLELRKEIFKKI